MRCKYRPQSIVPIGSAPLPAPLSATLGLAALCFALLGLAAAGLPASLRAAEAPRVLIKDFMFTPKSLTVKAGTAVTWLNLDDEPHNVVSDTGLFRSGGFDTNESFSYKFDTKGTYRITCSLHPRMTATIVVE